MRELSEKDRRVLIVGGICVGVIVALMLLTDWLGHWGLVRKSLAEKRDKFKSISVSEAKRAGLRAVVPVFEMPRAYEEQKYLFRDKFYEQLKEAGIKYESLQFLALERSRRGRLPAASSSVSAEQVQVRSGSRFAGEAEREPVSCWCGGTEDKV